MNGQACSAGRQAGRGYHRCREVRTERPMEAALRRKSQRGSGRSLRTVVGAGPDA